MRTIQVSAVQFSYKPIKSFKDFEKNIEELMKKSNGSEIVVFPEVVTFEFQYLIPKYDLTKLHEFTEDYKILFKRLSEEFNQIIFAGSQITLEEETSYNTGFIFHPDGKVLSHRKTHIMPAEAGAGITRGDSLGLFEINGIKIGLVICYEMEFPEIARSLTLQGAEILLCPSNTLDEYGFWRVRHCCQARAIENQVYVVHSCLVGKSAIPGLDSWGMSSIISPCESPWNPNGVICEAEPNKEMVITGELNLDLLKKKRKRGIAPTLKDRRPELY
ncbi:MAG: nitrilase-related carbon-nitrogen hydrolase [Promethearchaeota archaeon]|jgi:predicted amidohydrolase